MMITDKKRCDLLKRLVASYTGRSFVIVCYQHVAFAILYNHLGSINLVEYNQLSGELSCSESSIKKVAKRYRMMINISHFIQIKLRHHIKNLQ